MRVGAIMTTLEKGLLCAFGCLFVLKLGHKMSILNLQAINKNNFYTDKEQYEYSNMIYQNYPKKMYSQITVILSFKFEKENHKNQNHS